MQEEVSVPRTANAKKKKENQHASTTTNIIRGIFIRSRPI